MKLGSKKKIHLVGIGGIGMSGVAEILLRTGYEISGSDLRSNQETKRLKGLGARICLGHKKENLKDADVVVFSSAIAHDNPEIVESKRRGLVLLPRAEMLSELMRKKRSVVVAGSHGKTTTTALIATILLEAGQDPTAFVGGKLRSIASHVKMGKNEWFVAESDESDGSFLHLLPTIAVITNIDREHLEHYGSFSNLMDAFADFANHVPFDGLVVLCRDDSNAEKLLPRIHSTVATYGVRSEADLVAEIRGIKSGRTEFELRKGKKKICRVSLPLTGVHNVLNSTAAASVALHLGLSGKEIAKGLASFGGIERRLESKGIYNDVQIIDDYAHHPTEIQSTLEALRPLASDGAIRVLFQPHRYTRLRDLWKEFVAVFDAADEVVVVPVYAASEDPIADVSSENFVKDIQRRKRTAAEFASDLTAAACLLAKRAKSHDVVVTMGAGDVTKAGPLILSAMEGKLDAIGRSSQ